nr:hypothetical protein [Tanacetum cinerariifolium]
MENRIEAWELCLKNKKEKKTKRKLVSKNVVIGSVGESINVGTRGSSLCHVDEGSEAFVVGDNDLGSVPLNRKHMSPDRDQVYRFQPNVGTSSGVHMPTELNVYPNPTIVHYDLSSHIFKSQLSYRLDKLFNIIIQYLKLVPAAVSVVDYQIHTEHNKPYYKIIRADGTHQLFLSFISLLRNFDREDLEMVWKIIQERFESLEPKNFLDEFLLNTLKTMFEMPNVEAYIWKNQRGNYGLAKVKSWKLLKSCGVHIITFTTTHMILLVKRRYHLTRFTLDQMLNNVRLKIEEESEVSLELLRFVRRQQQEGYKIE